MIQKQSYIDVADNTGARKLLCLRVIPGKKRIAIPGDTIVSVVKRALSIKTTDLLHAQKTNSTNSKILIQKSEIVLSVVVRIKTFLNRDNGFFVAFDKNAAVLIKQDKTARGTRIIGPVSKEIRKSSCSKLISLATQIV